MKNRFISFYATFVTIIFISVIAFLSYNIFNEYNTGIPRTINEFRALKNELESLSNKKNFNDINWDILVNNAQKAVNSSNSDYAKIVISKDGKTYFSFQNSDNIPSEDTNYIRINSETLNVAGVNVFITAAMYTIRPAVISHYSKISFLIILAFTCLTIFIIIFTSLHSKISYSDDDEESFEPISLDPNNSVNCQTENSFEEEKKNDESADSENIESDTGNINEPLISGADNELNTTFPEQEKSEIKKVELPVEDMRSSENNENPQGLFSPVTGFGWESYLKTRLDSELERACASEFDVSLFIIKISNFEKLEKEIIEKICAYLTEIFQFKDMIFEYKTDCFACIKTSTNIDDAIHLADKIHQELSDYISNTDSNCFIGLSSRTIRLVSGERLLIEAGAALDHAIESPDSPIIAFRANAEKYMKFIEKNN